MRILCLPLDKPSSPSTLGLPVSRLDKKNKLLCEGVWILPALHGFCWLPGNIHFPPIYSYDISSLHHWRNMFFYVIAQEPINCPHSYWSTKCQPAVYRVSDQASGKEYTRQGLGLGCNQNDWSLTGDSRRGSRRHMWPSWAIREPGLKLTLYELV